MAALGVDTVHTLVHWRGFVPSPTADKRPAGFDGTDPADYPSDRWNPLDDLLRGAQARGLQVILTPTSQVPRWAERCSDRERRRYWAHVCKPSPTLFGDFVEALARRYDGTYRDESDGATLPAVTRWSIWNEPNQGGWLAPQTKRVGRRTVSVAASAYRSLVHQATGALRVAGHAGDQVLLGETAPLGGGSANSTAPVPFYETLFCVDHRGHRLRGDVARATGCRRKPKRMAVTGIAHHPYTRGAGDALLKKQPTGAITIAYTSRLRHVARLGARSGAISKRVGGQVFFTEFGVSSKPPGERYSVPLATQAEWINQADYIAFRDPAVRGVAQYGLEDDTTFRRKTFQTGLCFPNGADPCYPKAAWDAYRVPLYVVDRGKRVLVFGQARPTGANPRQVIEVQNRAGSSAQWQTVDTVELNAAGYFMKAIPKLPGTWRLSWTPRLGATPFLSREAVPRKR
ncbi:MAG TPA: hypothetical protein VF520_09540 [Thermoleophilaceae bacterium]|jgi:hypothetical protein